MSSLTNGVGIPAVMGVTWALFGFVLVLTGLRLYVTTRRWTRRLTCSDVFLLLALAWHLCESIFSAWTLYKRPKDRDVDLEAVKDYEIVAAMYFYTFFVAIYCIKASFLAFYYPMFAVTPRWSRVCFWTVCCYDAACLVATILQQSLTCVPFRRYWEVENHCEPYYERSYFIGVTVMNITSDFTIMFLPLLLMHQISKLRGRERTGIAFVVLIGLLSICASCIRFAVIWKVTEDFTVSHAKSVTTIEMLFSIEWAAAYTAACLPSFKAWLRSSSSSSSSFFSFSFPWRGHGRRKSTAAPGELKLDASGSTGTTLEMGLGQAYAERGRGDGGGGANEAAVAQAGQTRGGRLAPWAGAEEEYPLARLPTVQTEYTAGTRSDQLSAARTYSR